MSIKSLQSFLERELRKKKVNRLWYSKSLPIEIPKAKKRELIKNGFYPSSILFFDFEKYGYDLYLCERDYRRYYPLNRPSVSALIDNKAYLGLILQNHPEWLPELFAHLENGEIIYTRWMNSTPYDLNIFIQKALETHEQLIIKPTSDGGGRGVFSMDLSNWEQKLQTLYSGNWVISNRLENDQVLKNIFPHALNSTRVVFFKNRNRENKILMIGQRFGTSNSAPVDNISSGGLGYSVDLETGKFSKPYSFQPGFTSGQFDFHPDTAVRLKGFQFDDWPDRLKQIQTIVEALDFVDYAGLDLAFTPQGVKIIEINSHPESIFTQLDGPVLLNQEFREFIESRSSLFK